MDWTWNKMFFSWKRGVRTDQWNLLWLSLIKGCSVIDIDGLSLITECSLIGMSDWACRWRNVLWVTKPDDGMFCDWTSRMGWSNVLWLTKPDDGMFCHWRWRTKLDDGDRMTDWAWWQMTLMTVTEWSWRPDDGMFFDWWWLTEPLWLTMMGYRESDSGIFYNMLDDDRLSLTRWRNDDERKREKRLMLSRSKPRLTLLFFFQ
jgi:hypothetical protein